MLGISARRFPRHWFCSLHPPVLVPSTPLGESQGAVSKHMQVLEAKAEDLQWENDRQDDQARFKGMCPQHLSEVDLCFLVMLFSLACSLLYLGFWDGTLSTSIQDLRDVQDCPMLGSFVWSRLIDIYLAH